jgi:hypothetical protein
MADTSIFSRLRRLFSTDVVIRNVGGNDLKVIDTNKIQSAGEIETNSLVDRFSRLYTTNPSSLYAAQYNINYQTLRPTLYSEYDVMDQDAICASALDVVADECTLKNDMDEVLSIKSADEDIQKILYNLFYDVLNIEFNLWSWTRQMCKYGDFFLKLEIAEKFGVYNVVPYTAFNMTRQEAYDPDNPASVRFIFNPEGLTGQAYGGFPIPNQSYQPPENAIVFDNYEMAHFRLISDVAYLPYGRSYLEPGRKLFKQYVLMEDAMLIHRIARAPEKRIFYINVGSIPPNEIDAFMQKTISKMKRTPYMDETTGEYNLKYNMQNLLEDFYIPVRGNDQATKIDTTKGLDYDGIQDVEYLRDKLFAALKVPKAYLGYDENLEGKATLAAEDIRFARTIDRIQRILLSELNKIALVHLYTQGYQGEQLTNFELKLTSPSIIFEQEKIELMKSKVDLARELQDTGLMPTDWIYDNVFHLSEDQYDEYRDLIIQDKKRQFRRAQIEAEGNDPLETGKSYGTPHDLASLYGKGRGNDSNPFDVPSGYNDDLKPGRPKERNTNVGKQENNFGKDPLGTKRMKDTDKNDSSDSRTDTNKSGLAMESAKTAYFKNKDMFKNIPVNNKQLVFEDDKRAESLLDEKQLKE